MSKYLQEFFMKQQLNPHNKICRFRQNCRKINEAGNDFGRFPKVKES